MKLQFTAWRRGKLLKDLEGDETKRQIMSYLLEAWNAPPAVAAAREMYTHGITAHDLYACINHQGFELLPSEWLNNTINELRNMERGQ